MAAAGDCKAVHKRKATQARASPAKAQRRQSAGSPASHTPSPAEQLSAALNAALMPVDDSVTIGLPVPPLVAIVAAYLTPAAFSTYCDQKTLSECPPLADAKSIKVIPTGSSFSTEGVSFLIDFYSAIHQRFSTSRLGGYGGTSHTASTFRYALNGNHLERLSSMTTVLDHPRVICFDPNNPNRFFSVLVENGGSSIVSIDHSGVRTLIAKWTPSNQYQSSLIGAMICNHDSSALWFLNNESVFAADQVLSVSTTPNSVVRTYARGTMQEFQSSDGRCVHLMRPRDLCCVGDRFICISTDRSIHRFDSESGRLDAITMVNEEGELIISTDDRPASLEHFDDREVRGIASTPSGSLIVACFRRLFLVNPMTGLSTLLAGGGGFDRKDENDLLKTGFAWKMVFAVVERDQSLIVSDPEFSSLRRVQLPSSLFEH